MIILKKNNLLSKVRNQPKIGIIFQAEKFLAPTHIFCHL